MARREARLGVALFAALGGAACSSATYSACPILVPNELPEDAFSRCKEILRTRFGGFDVVDEAAFRLQTTWLATRDPPGEARATVFRDATPDRPDGLALVVEVRRLTEPMFGLPGWTAVRGDPAAERELADVLARGLTSPSQ